MKINTAPSLSKLEETAQEIAKQEAAIKEGGGPEGQARQKRLGRLTARERLNVLLDPKAPFFEIGLWAGYEMYEEWGGLPAGGVVAGIGQIEQRLCMVIANDATVKAGAMFPQAVKKMLRAQKMAFENRLPIIYLVDSAGVFLPLQDEIFPDDDDFGRIFRNNSILSAAGIPQFAAIMGNCIAGGGYLPVLCDKLLMTEGSGLYLAGPALVKAAIGQVVETEELGGAKMHAEISGTVDFYEKDDPSCLQRLRNLVSFLPAETRCEIAQEKPLKELYRLIDPRKGYDAVDLIKLLADQDSVQIYKADYGKTLVTAYAKVGGHPVGFIANQRLQTKTGKGEVEIGGVIYPDSADKAARFIMDCNQLHIPLVFLQDVVGFMVGKEAEQAGIIRAGAKLVNVVSNSIVPKITIVVGNSFGAGNYALCGKAYDPNFIVAWPNAKYAVMGGDQAADTLAQVQLKASEKKGKKLNADEVADLKKKVKDNYLKQMDIRYGAARGWIDAIIAPEETRNVLLQFLQVVKRAPLRAPQFQTGVIQV